MLYLPYHTLLLSIALLAVLVSCHNRIRNLGENLTVVNCRIPQAVRCATISCVRKRYKYPYLLAFHKNGCEFCQDMEPLIHRINTEHNVYIERLDVESNYNYAVLRGIHTEKTPTVDAETG
ncbi:thioredoxin-like protein, putative [Babesia caballi]|uniref:Thioredoxin-like protein, putative n=1 Tax=Babesia caballi TaxID=5871 RepID=A0AAV4LSG9_BABCB|nr:thioredoxin-like protein, putative [Babesia caballi]